MSYLPGSSSQGLEDEEKCIELDASYLMGYVHKRMFKPDAEL
jgi:hypothetical protein